MLLEGDTPNVLFGLLLRDESRRMCFTFILESFMGESHQSEAGQDALRQVLPSRKDGRTRVVAVGDPFQAIDGMHEQHQAREFKTTYAC